MRAGGGFGADLFPAFAAVDYCHLSFSANFTHLLSRCSDQDQQEWKYSHRIPSLMLVDYAAHVRACHRHLEEDMAPDKVGPA